MGDFMIRYKSTLVMTLFILFLPFCTSVYPEERFTDNDDGTITDHHLNLMWARTDNFGDINWHQAEKWIRFTFPYTLPVFFENWRLPTLEELKSLYVRDDTYTGYEAECGQPLKVTREIHLTCGFIWSSDRESITAQVFNFKRGITYSDRLVHKRGYRALAVRDLQ